LLFAHQKTLQASAHGSSGILAILEAESRRILVPSQPRQIVCQTLAGKNSYKKGLVEWLKVWTEFNQTPVLKKKKDITVCKFLGTRDKY
jgi:hypothetical protein